MSDLTLLLDDLISCGNKLTETAQALKDYYSAPAPTEEKVEKPKKEKPKKETPKEEPKEDEPKTYKDVEVSFSNFGICPMFANSSNKQRT